MKIFIAVKIKLYYIARYANEFNPSKGPPINQSFKPWRDLFKNETENRTTALSWKNHACGI